MSDEPADARRIHARHPVDLDRTLSLFVRGPDPTMKRDTRGGWWRAMWTPDGAATLRVASESPTQLYAEAWGPGADWALSTAPDLVGANDSLEGFEPTGIVADLHRREPGFRIARARTIFQCLVLPILEQKVSGKEARIGYMAMVKALGQPAPGPAPLLMPPSAEAIAATPSWKFREWAIEGKRADTLVLAASRAKRLEALADVPVEEAHRKLQSLRGIGPWTTAELARLALGDADAVSVRDYWWPRQIAYTLADELEADDDRMMELLEPYRGHRGRVGMLVVFHGKALPRKGPRIPLRKFVSDAQDASRFPRRR